MPPDAPTCNLYKLNMVSLVVWCVPGWPELGLAEHRDTSQMAFGFVKLNYPGYLISWLAVDVWGGGRHVLEIRFPQPLNRFLSRPLRFSGVSD